VDPSSFVRGQALLSPLLLLFPSMNSQLVSSLVRPSTVQCARAIFFYPFDRPFSLSPVSFSPIAVLVPLSVSMYLHLFPFAKGEVRFPLSSSDFFSPVLVFNLFSPRPVSCLLLSFLGPHFPLFTTVFLCILVWRPTFPPLTRRNPLPFS